MLITLLTNKNKSLLESNLKSNMELMVVRKVHAFEIFGEGLFFGGFM